MSLRLAAARGSKLSARALPAGLSVRPAGAFLCGRVLASEDGGRVKLRDLLSQVDRQWANKLDFVAA